MNSVTFGQDRMDPPLWAILKSKRPSNYTLDQDISFVATPVVNNFERVKPSSNSLTFSQGGTGLTSVGPQAPLVSMVLGKRYQDSIYLQLPGPEGERLSYRGGTWGRRISLCLGRGGHQFFSVLLVHSLGRVLALGQSCPMVSIITIQAETLWYPGNFFGDLGVTARIWESLLIVISFFH